MKRKRTITTAIVFALAALAATGAVADDFIVNVGETGRIEGTKTYGRILCNGELTIDDDAIVTCTSFVMASGVVQNVKVAIGNNATVTVNGANGSTTGYECAIGMDGGSGMLTLGTNATFYCTMAAAMQTLSSYGAASFTAENPFPSTAKMFMHLKKGAKFAAKNSITDAQFAFSTGYRLDYTGCARFVGNTIQLDEDATMDFCAYLQYSRPDSRIVFNGGKIAQNCWNNSKTATLVNNVGWSHKAAGARMYLTATNGNPIVVDKSKWSSAVFATTASGGGFTLEGDGDFVLRCSGAQSQWVNGSWTRFIDVREMNKDYMNFNHTGAIRFEGSAYLWLVGRSTAIGTYPDFIEKKLFKGTRDLYIGPNIRMDLFGNTVKAKKLEASSGNLFSTCTTNNATLCFGLGNADSKLENIGTNVVCVKCGTGSLVMSNATNLAGLNVTTGSVSFASLPGGPTVGIDKLTLGKDTSFTLGDGRTLAVKDVVLDSSASASVSSLAPAAGGSLNLTSFTRTPGMQLLPFAVESLSGAMNLKTWSLYFNDVLQGTVGAADPEIHRYRGHLALGTPGFFMTVR